MLTSSTSTQASRRHHDSAKCSTAVSHPGHGLPRRIRDQPRHHDRQRGSARPGPGAATRPPGTCSGSSTATTWRSPALVLTAGSLGDRFGRRPALLRRPGRLRCRQRDRRARRLSGRTDRRAVRDGRVRRPDLPDDAVDHHQHLPRAPRAGQGDRHLGRGHRASASRSGRSPAASCSPTYSWPSVFVALVPVAARRDGRRVRARCPSPATRTQPRLDPPGPVVLVGRDRHCSSTRSSRRPRAAGVTRSRLAGFVAAAILVGWRSSRSSAGAEQPMIDVSLFRTPAFSAASGAVTVAFFALFGFIFLVTQYFQFIRGYGTLVHRRADPARRGHDRPRDRLGRRRRARRPASAPARSSPPACCCSAPRSAGSRCHRRSCATARSSGRWCLWASASA